MKSKSKVEKRLAEVLTEFRDTATSESDKGTKFERLTKFYLIHDPIWTEQLTNVRLREEARIGPDVGIDLVAEDLASGGKVAIQCKFYDEKTYLDDLGTFVTASGKEGYVRRIVVSTSNQWTKNAEDALKNQQIPIQRILLHDMEQSLIDWGSFDLTKNYGSVPIAQKELRPHQVEALNSVMEGFKGADRGKVIMACGTGKTLTSLRIAEEFAKKNKKPTTVLFLAPSISLLSQTIMEWGQNKKAPYMALAVCSDAKVGKKDDDDMMVNDLAIPASTDVEKLLATLSHRGDKDLVVFSTYQSLEIISKAQKSKKNPLPEIDLVICDEAHRTTGVTQAAKAAVDDFSHFVRIHDNEYVKAGKRLYMTATPKIYKDVDNKVAESGGVIASMDDPEKFGEEFFRLGFGEAVEKGLLSDYRVLILAVDEEYVARTDLERFRSEDSTINLDDASKLLGCWRGLSKIKTIGEDVDDIPMKRAVAFANTIDASQVLAKRLEIVGRTANRPTEGNTGLTLQTRHVDGTQNALVRRQNLEWLKAESGIATARILTNARCLSEGIDVPALDAVIFTEARGSQVDIVQAVGRVMRKHEGKNSGYIILPVAISSGADISATLKGTKYKVIWDVLNALRAHDDRFDVIVNQINLNQDRDSKIEVDVVTGDGPEDLPTSDEFEQGILVHLPSQIADGIYAKIVEKVGERNYWEKWAKDIADIAKSQSIRIEVAISGKNNKATKEFARFLTALQNTLNKSITQADAIEMLSQHLITKPIFDALFANYKFTENNPVSISMDDILKVLSSEIEMDNKLSTFYAQVNRRIEGIDNNASRQKLITELYERFFKLAFPEQVRKLGIVYTPIEIVDFILWSVEHILVSEFNSSISQEGIKVIDPFTGTGTFIVRLLQSGIINNEKLAYKYHNEIFASEIVLLAYYIAAINIESTLSEITESGYSPFDGIILADTFQMYEKDDRLDIDVFVSNNARSERQRQQDIRVIIANPPYSVGQQDQNDANKNVSYPSLDSRIRLTYAAKSSAINLSVLYDSYIRAFRWASDRVGDSGVIGFVTNGSFIDNKAMDGFRRTLVDDFTSIYIFNLRGNARTSGALRRAERGNVFGEGSKTPIAITILVKNPKRKNEGSVYIHNVGDFLTREDKLKVVRESKSIEFIEWEKVTIDSYGDWVNQRDKNFENYDAIGIKNIRGQEGIFNLFSGGVKTARDAWVFNFSKDSLKFNISTFIDYYNSLIPEVNKISKMKATIDKDSLNKLVEKHLDNRRISWDRSLIADLGKKKSLSFDSDAIRVSLYRPFCKKYLYFDNRLNEMIYQIKRIFPDSNSKNLVISLNTNQLQPFGALMTDSIPDAHLTGDSQIFPLYIYTDSDVTEDLFSDPLVNSMRRNSAISERTIEKYRKLFGSEISEEDIFYYIYGLLHHPIYKTRYAVELSKALPRIPVVEEFGEVSKIGRDLGNLHVSFDTQESFKFTNLSDSDIKLSPVRRFQHIKLNGGSLDKTRILVNDSLVLEGIPAEAYGYEVNGRSAIDWVLERFEIKEDAKTSILQDPNNFSDEPGYGIKHLGRVINVSLNTIKLVDSLPPLTIINR